ncbi:DUF3300 domain-containing protein [Pseudaminobacter sp. 19-2017]|uniref:DUF3300 domain-containing protein n=1 Tax=Pseudaminobacter soli (ex Zhang et al. 2022) TaxID=2831468 RepID=A0A942I4J0_9HYPH|nr:DUF3300 domain-containing protein [Pseudaminobacter soli]MBS3651544.1 DUF3300 domain-containing protein [Pseudaminobacter soli]
MAGSWSPFPGLVTATLAFLISTAGDLPGAWAQEQATAATAASKSAALAEPEPLSADELEELVAPIALYPDELLALVCSASLFPLQIVEAERFLEKRAKDKSLEPKESWDASVISLLNYPDVVKMMAEDLEWTQALGDALANQQKDVLTAIQQLRDEAVAKDIIKTDDKVKVVQSGDNIIIQSANPETIYVPRYEPEMLYVPSYPPEPISYYSDPYPNYYWPSAGFWAGAATGAFFGAIVDWDDWGVWGGNWGGDVDMDVDCNNCLNNINGKIDWKDVDWKNVDRSKINFDRNQLANIDRNRIQQGLESNRANSIRDKASNVRSERPANLSNKAVQARDVRKNVLDTAQKRPGNLADARPQQRPSASARPDRPQQGQRANARTDRPQAATRPSGGAKKSANRPSGKPKAGARVDNRPSKPSGLGNVDRGRVTKVNSSRGRQSMGGGYRGGGGHAVRTGGSRGGAMGRGGGRGGGGRGGRGR